MLLILAAMIIGSSLTAFSSPIGSSNAGLSGLRLLPQKPDDAPFSSSNALAATPNGETGKASQRGTLINLSV
jgi:hypothetical protein